MGQCWCWLHTVHVVFVQHDNFSIKDGCCNTGCIGLVPCCCIIYYLTINNNLVGGYGQSRKLLCKILTNRDKQNEEFSFPSN